MKHEQKWRTLLPDKSFRTWHTLCHSLLFSLLRWQIHLTWQNCSWPAMDTYDEWETNLYIISHWCFGVICCWSTTQTAFTDTSSFRLLGTRLCCSVLRLLCFLCSDSSVDKRHFSRFPIAERAPFTTTKTRCQKTETPRIWYTSPVWTDSIPYGIQDKTSWQKWNLSSCSSLPIGWLLQSVADIQRCTDQLSL